MKKKKYWAGFCNGHIHICNQWESTITEIEPTPAIFVRKKDAKKQYEDVRPVEIKEISKQKAKQKKRRK